MSNEVEQWKQRAEKAEAELKCAVQREDALRWELIGHREKAQGNYWAWQGDNDHLESLVTHCPVLIQAKDLKEIISKKEKAEAACAEMRVILEVAQRNWVSGKIWTMSANDLNHALSSDCGKDHIPASELDAARKAAIDEIKAITTNGSNTDIESQAKRFNLDTLPVCTCAQESPTYPVFRENPHKDTCRANIVYLSALNLGMCGMKNVAKLIDERKNCVPRSELDFTINGKSLLSYLIEQFPVIKGHKPIYDFCDRLETLRKESK